MKKNVIIKKITTYSMMGFLALAGLATINCSAKDSGSILTNSDKGGGSQKEISKTKKNPASTALSQGNPKTAYITIPGTTTRKIKETPKPGKANNDAGVKRTETVSYSLPGRIRISVNNPVRITTVTVPHTETKKGIGENGEETEEEITTSEKYKVKIKAKLTLKNGKKIKIDWSYLEPADGENVPTEDIKKVKSKCKGSESTTVLTPSESQISHNSSLDTDSSELTMSSFDLKYCSWYLEGYNPNHKSGTKLTDFSTLTSDLRPRITNAVVSGNKYKLEGNAHLLPMVGGISKANANYTCVQKGGTKQGYIDDRCAGSMAPRSEPVMSSVYFAATKPGKYFIASTWFGTMSYTKTIKLKIDNNVTLGTYKPTTVGSVSGGNQPLIQYALEEGIYTASPVVQKIENFAHTTKHFTYSVGPDPDCKNAKTLSKAGCTTIIELPPAKPPTEEDDGDPDAKYNDVIDNVSDDLTTGSNSKAKASDYSESVAMSRKYTGSSDNVNVKATSKDDNASELKGKKETYLN